MPILEVQHLYKNFGSTKVLKDISSRPSATWSRGCATSWRCWP